MKVVRWNGYEVGIGKKACGAADVAAGRCPIEERERRVAAHAARVAAEAPRASFEDQQRASGRKAGEL